MPGKETMTAKITTQNFPFARPDGPGEGTPDFIYTGPLRLCMRKPFPAEDSETVCFPGFFQ